MAWKNPQTCRYQVCIDRHTHGHYAFFNRSAELNERIDIVII